jgi:orotidine-5'-phosphate decarboxylase
LDADGEPRLWHVTVTVAGPEESLEQVREGLESMSHDHPFLMSGRYATDRAEVRYWEEAEDVHDALALALRLWGEHRESSGLPHWMVVGLEVVDRDTHRRRGEGAALLSPGVRPF